MTDAKHYPTDDFGLANDTGDRGAQPLKPCCARIGVGPAGYGWCSRPADHRGDHFGKIGPLKPIERNR